MGLASSWRIARHERETLELLTELSTADLLAALVPHAQRMAVTPVSHYNVGCALLGSSGDVYLGANVEFLGSPLNASVHAEQSAMANAMLAQAAAVRRAPRSPGTAAPAPAPLPTPTPERLVMLAVSASPCGHCRQFLREALDGVHLQVLIARNETDAATGTGPARKHSGVTLDALLPDSFGPEHLGNAAPLLAHAPLRLRATGPPTRLRPGQQADGSPADPPSAAALLKAVLAAGLSYAPYTSGHAAVVLELSDGRLFEGLYMENAAFNPSLPPLQSALTHLYLGSGSGLQGTGASGFEVVHAVLAERSADLSHRTQTAATLERLFPRASLDYVQLEVAE